MNPNKPMMIMMVGLPGTGKSTFINQNFKDLNVVSTDNIIEQMASEKGITYSEAFNDCIKIATKKFFEQISNNVESNVSFVVDRTNLSTNSRKKILDLIPSEYNKIAIVVSLNDETEHFRRLNNRPGKIIPDHVVQTMKKSFEMPSKSEGFHKIYVREM